MSKKLNKKIVDSIENKHTMWWEYREADYTVRTDLGGYRLLALTQRFENGSTGSRVNYKTQNFKRVAEITEALQAKGVQIDMPPKFVYWE